MPYYYYENRTQGTVVNTHTHTHTHKYNQIEREKKKIKSNQLFICLTLSFHAV